MFTEVETLRCYPWFNFKAIVQETLPAANTYRESAWRFTYAGKLARTDFGGVGVVTVPVYTAVALNLL